MLGTGLGELRGTCCKHFHRADGFWYLGVLVLALLWAHAAWLRAFPRARPCPQPGGSPDTSPCRAGSAEAGGWQRCFAQHVQYNLYLFPAGVAFPVTFPTKPFAGGSPQPRAPAAERPRRPCREPSSAVTGRARPGRGSLAL